MQVIKPLIVASFVAASAPLFAAPVGGSAPATLTDAQRDEVRALVKEVLADANTRSTFVGGATAGIGSDGKVFLRSEDDAFGMEIGGLVQMRYGYHNKVGMATSDEGFDLRRVELDIQGHLGGQDQARVNYRVLLGTNVPTVADPGVGLKEAYLSYEMGEGFTLQGGKFTLPYSREALISAGSQVAVERSSTNGFFGLGRAEGAQIQWTDTKGVLLRAAASNGGNTDTTPVYGDAVNFAACARGDFLLVGSGKVSMEDFKDNFALRDGSDKQAVLLGVGGYYEDASVSAPLIAGNRLESSYGITADATFKLANLAFYGAAFAQRRNVDNVQDNVIPWGVLAQADVGVANNVDLFAQWNFVNDDSVTGLGAASHNSFQSMVAGVNYHVNSRVRLTGDVVWVYAGDGLLGNVGPGTPAGVGGAGAGLGAGVAGEVAVRLQAQVKF